MARAVRAEEEVVELDRLEDYPHPREAAALFGHAEAEKELLDAYRQGRMHHGWLIHGEEGIGKATLAYRLAKFVLANPIPDSAPVQAARDLSVPPDVSAARHVAAQSHPDLHVLRRGLHPRTKTVQAVISVDSVREALQFFSMTAGTGGWRILIVDAADALNISAANALLKTLEEPPARCLLLLVAHNPGKLLPTIRSRCRRLALTPLSPDDLQRAVDQASAAPRFDALGAPQRQQLVTLAGGSVRTALSLLDDGLLDIYREVAMLIRQADRLDQTTVHGLAARMARQGRGDKSTELLDVIQHCLAARVQELANTGDPHALAKLAEVWEKTRHLAAQTETFHFDRKQVILNVFRWIEAASR